MAYIELSDYPPFPNDIPTAKLSKISLEKLFSADQGELNALYAACMTSGFFVLDLTVIPQGVEVLTDVAQAFEMAKELFKLDLEEKMKYSMGPGKAYGYKAEGFSKVDDKGTPDRCEFWGLSKDGITNNTDAPTPIPEVVAAHYELVERLIRRAHAICLLILSRLESYLGFESGKLTSVHRLQQTSADQLRLLKMPPQPHGDRRTSLLAHTDFGSVTLLWNILGGLQILPPGNNGDDPNVSDAWEYVQPQQGCAVVNMGDAMVEFSGGIVRSNLHRVWYAPGEQALVDRYSIAYFTRPEDDVLMKRLSGAGEEGAETEGTGQKLTAKKWSAMKSEMYRKGMGTMKSSGGALAAE